MSHQHPLILSLVIIMASICPVAEARTVYAITEHSSGTIKAYRIQGSQLGSPYAQSALQGEALDITVDSQQKLLFLTLEGGNIICADANTLAQKGSLTTPEMAGIVADEAKQKVYSVVRGGNQLYVCKWDGDKLVLINIVTLADLGSYGALGIALDKVARRLYVTNDTNTVNYYDADDPCWAHLGSRNVGVSAMDIDVDTCRGYLYIGGYQESGSSYTYIVKHNLSTDVNSNTQQDIGTAVIGIAVDPLSGLVYVTTSSRQVQVYNCSSYPFIQNYSVDTNGTSSGPAGICVESAGGWLNFTKSDDVNNGDCVLPGREINYTITYDFNGTGDTNVTLVDYLPVEVDYNSSSPEGNYDSVMRTVTWNIGTVPSDGNGTFTISGQVNNLAEPCNVFTNACRIAGDTIYMDAEVNTPVCAWNPGIIYVDCNRTGGKNNGMSWQNAYTDLQKALNRAGIGGGSEIWVAEGNYSPSVWDPCQTSGGPTFKLINTIPLYGHFAGTETSINQRDFNNPTYATILCRGINTYTYRVVTASGLSQNNIIDGFTITGANNEAGIKIQNAYLKISNCLITNNSSYGINAINSAFTVIDCIIQNSSVGINTDFGNNGTLSETRITDCVIRNNNNYDGIYLYRANSQVTIKNCSIYNNYRGISTFSHSFPPVIIGCKIFSNNPLGIMTSNSNTGAYILNNWICRNRGYGIFLAFIQAKIESY